MSTSTEQATTLTRVFLPWWPDFPEHLVINVRAATADYLEQTGGHGPQYLTVQPDPGLIAFGYGTRQGHPAVRIDLSPVPVRTAAVFDNVAAYQAMQVAPAVLADPAALAGRVAYFLDRPDAPENYPSVRDADPDNPPKVWVDLRPWKNAPLVGSNAHLLRCAIEYPTGEPEPDQE